MKATRRKGFGAGIKRREACGSIIAFREVSQVMSVEFVYFMDVSVKSKRR